MTYRWIARNRVAGTGCHAFVSSRCTPFVPVADGEPVLGVVGPAELDALRSATGTDGGYLVCQIDDAGAGLADPLAGYRPPGTEQRAGRGLWLARQVVDLMQIAPGHRGTSVRFQVPIATANTDAGSVAE